MNNEGIIFCTTYTGFTPHPATWNSIPIDIMNPATKTLSYWIEWTDVAITFYLYRANLWDGSSSPTFFEDFTASYRAIDPGWIDPALGDPFSNHFVSMQNIGAKYVWIGWSASNWAGAGHYLRITQVVERYAG